MSNHKSDLSMAQLTLPQQGRSQSQRLPAALKDDYVGFDERDKEALFSLVKQLAADVSFYQHNSKVADGNWQDFFPYRDGQSEQWLNQQRGHVPPHLALFDAFINALQQGPQAELNQLKQKYLSHYYQQVLRFKPKPAHATRAHVVLGLKKQAPSQLVTSNDLLTAGKRQDGSEINVEPIEDSVINQAQVVDIRSQYHHADEPGVIRVAPIANSADGLGTDFGSANQKWPGFGHKQLPIGEFGLALSSPLLWLREGHRSITLTLQLSAAISADETTVDDLFAVSLTTMNGWTVPQLVNGQLNGQRLTVTCTLTNEDHAISAYQQQSHGLQLNTQQPVIQLLVNPDASRHWRRHLLQQFIHWVKLDVSVTGVKQLQIKSDTGVVDPTASFFPFGPQPKSGATCTIDSDEVFSKRLRKLTLHLNWKSPPQSLHEHYANYDKYVTMPKISNSYFGADAAAIDHDKRLLAASEQPLFQHHNAALPQRIDLLESQPAKAKSSSEAKLAKQLGSHNSHWSQQRFNSLSRIKPSYQPLGEDQRNKQSSKRQQRTFKIEANDTVQSANLILTLKQDFFHQTFRNAYVKNVIAANDNKKTVMINEPYTPELSSISIDYQAYSNEVTVSSINADDFANDELKLFHIDCFGQRPEHSYQRAQLSFVSERRVPLFPEHQEQGALLIGLSNLAAGQSCQLLFQLVDGSADPNLPAATLQWSVLCDNYWQLLNQQQLVFDRSKGLLRSGLVKLLIPTNATTTNSLMPTGLIWLKVATNDDVAAINLLRGIYANAIEVVVQNSANRTDYDALLAGTIGQFKLGGQQVKTVQHPFDGYAGAAAESAADFATRVAERLKHKDRALTIDDIERLTLQAFANVHRVKAIPHARVVGDHGHFHSPGDITVVLVPRASNNAQDPYRPKADQLTIANAKALLSQRTSMQTTIHVVNPLYLQLQLRFKVRFTAGLEFNYYRDQLQNAIQHLLSPWLTNSSAAGDSPQPQFGGQIHKSTVMHFIEQQHYVEFITDVELRASLDGAEWSADQASISVTSPLQILTSSEQHVITEVGRD
ncbi:hypothetical protein GCM10011369_27170 [Neiella marina]|uniref:Baseplate protein J-like domain-containing protein n=1 Tax=Neiella marina TaxID=508461 RepID=A0A8J2U7B1_9GAMM|nr:hypothetical protein [Neiella marina]GGA83730.1 hypothetical protein GCM10011369_27170 [Neiella marina]